MYPLDFDALAQTFAKLRRAFDSVYGSSQRDATLYGFYSSGEYPGREEFSISGFLKRVAGIVNNTRIYSFVFLMPSAGPCRLQTGLGNAAITQGAQARLYRIILSSSELFAGDYPLEHWRFLEA